MASVTISPDEEYVIGSVYRLRFVIDKDSVDWDLTGATVTLYLKKPNGTTLTKSPTVDDATVGKCYYDTLTTDFDTAGLWKLSVLTVSGTITQETPPVDLVVVDSP